MWYDLKIPKTNIVTTTNKAVLIAMPHSSEYDGYKFWHPAKITDLSQKSAIISYSDEFVFKLIKNGKGKYNYKEVLDKKEVKASVIEEAFFKEEFGDPFETHIPTPLKAEHTEVIEELIDE